ncbi:MAG: hypothetical protein KF724_08300 [Phycisphaeraceae bacterium]|nr:hypothetical protein [Phycisphaeraceae bacterium]
MKQDQRAAVLCVFAVTTGHAVAGVSYTIDKAAWVSAAGGASNITQVNFGDVPANTLITNQWAPQGVSFTDGDDWSAYAWNPGYPQALKPAIGGKDIWNPVPPGIYEINMEFAAPLKFWGTRPLNYMGVHVEFYLGDTLVGDIFASNIPFGMPPNDAVAVFVGFQSVTPFDRVRLIPPPPPQGFTVAVAGMIEYMSFAVPAPSAALLLALVALRTRGRRRG